MPTNTWSKPPLMAIRSLLPAVFLLGSCTESSPVSPSAAATEVDLATGGRQIAIEISNRAQIERIDGQQFVAMAIRGKCPVGYTIMEEPLTLTQGELAFGQAGFPLPCTGHWERSAFRVFSTGSVEFRRGRAEANVALVVENAATGEFLRATDSETLKLRSGR
jgi:hypothetical protein